MPSASEICPTCLSRIPASLKLRSRCDAQTPLMPGATPRQEPMTRRMAQYWPKGPSWASKAPSSINGTAKLHKKPRRKRPKLSLSTNTGPRFSKHRGEPRSTHTMTLERSANTTRLEVRRSYVGTRMTRLSMSLSARGSERRTKIHQLTMQETRASLHRMYHHSLGRLEVWSGNLSGAALTLQA